ncbi:AMP-binding protein [Nocardia sp. NPDC024068]|uniref:AMP-binding protein n=1 Tax=Nocardia sp. NPDC024068 TaxID=3157197 RepID=UPI00340B2691
MTTLPQLIANAVETNPDGAALVLADGTGPLEQVSYADLDAWSSRLARALMARGIGPEDLVAVAIPRSLDAVLAVWAVAKTGAGFVPIDPAYPPGWFAHLLVDAGAVYGLAVSWVRNELPDEVEWLQVDTIDTARTLEQFSADPVTYADRIRPLRAEHPAYVSYAGDGETSPDGVVVTQAGLSGLCSEQQGRYRVEPEDRTLNFAPLPSDSAVLELLLALGGAATMVVVSPLVTAPDELTALLRRTGVTHAYLPADALPAIDPAGLDELSVVVTGRRPCPPEFVGRWAIPVGGGLTRAFYQGYGPAEATIMTSISSPLAPGGPPTLGTPIRGVTAHILDERLAAVPDGTVGELYLGGAQLARGYHRRPGRTAQLLVADPLAVDGTRLYRTGDLVRRIPGGEMEYVGRVAVPGAGGSSAPARGAAKAAGNGLPEEVPGRSAGYDPLPDYEESLPIREATAAPAEPESDDRLASAKRDLDLPGRGYLEMPDRQQTLGGRDHRPGANPPAPAAESAVPRPPVADDDWLSSGRQLPTPGEPAGAAGRTVAPSSARSAGDALAFYENPRSGPEEPPAAESPARPTGIPAAAGPRPGRPADSVASISAAAPFGAAPAGPGPLWPEPGAPADGPPAIAPPPPAAESPVERPASIPLSPGQRRLWERNRSAPETASDTVTAAMKLSGTLDATAMQAAVADVVDRHETLRTVYPVAGGGEPHQVVLPREQAVPEVVADPLPAAEVAGWLHTLSRTDFDVADPEQVPVRFALAEIGPREHIVAVVVHRILADEVSAGLLLRDLLRAFLGRRNRSRPLWQPLSGQYLDYYLARRAELGDITDPDSPAATRLAYWREQLAGLPPRLEFPLADPHPGAEGESVHDFEIGTRTHRRVTDIARRAGVSEFIVVRAAFAVLLSRSAAVGDIVLGSAVRGRDERELDDAIGPYANSVVLRTRIDPAESFLDLVLRVAESDRAAFSHADLPFEEMTAALGVDPSHFDVAVALRHNDIPRLEMPSLATEPVQVANPSPDTRLRLVIDPHRAPDGSPDGIAAALHYAADRFTEPAVAEFARRLQRVLTVAGGDPEGPVGDIDLLSRSDLDRLLVVWNDTRYPVAPELLLDGYRRTVAIRPDTPAVSDAGTELTYQEFDARVNRLARRLIAAGVGPDAVVGVAIRRSPDLVVALYAVLTAGGACLPLDPDDPARWTAQVLDTARPVCVLADRPDEPRLVAAAKPVAGRPAVPIVAADPHTLAQYSADPLRPGELLGEVRPANAAYALCASASADGPELAVLSHSAINNQITLMLAQFPLGFTDIYLQQNPATCDTSLWGLFLPLRAGAHLVLADPAAAGDLDRVAATIAGNGVTATDFGPAELAALANHADPEQLRTLREIFVTGEPLSPDAVAALRGRCGARVHNLYGTCETAVSATSWPAAGSAERSVPIGLPQWNTRVYVLDTRLRPVPPGVPGELYLAGDQLARGYAGRRGATADRFVANPFGYGQRMYRTGDLVLWRDATPTTPQRLAYLGRTDDRSRLRGHRIQPDLIAAALRALPEVADAVVLSRSATPGRPGDRLTAFVVPAPDAGWDDSSAGRLRAALSRSIPAHLVPAAYAAVESSDLADPARLPDPDRVPQLPPALPVEDDDPSEPPAARSADHAAAGGPLLDTAPTGTTGPGPEPAAPAEPADPEFTGELPATATAVRLLDNPAPGVEIRSIVLDVPADRTPESVEAMVRALVLRHPMLWARLEAGEQGTTLWIPPRGQRGERQYWWLGPESGENTVATDDVVQAAADALDPVSGRNIHFVLTGAEPERRLVVVANGLVVDDRSWRIIIDGLGTGALGDARETRLPELARALDARARSIDLLDEAGWWRRNLAAARTTAPIGTADLHSRRRVSLAITAEGTAAVTAAAGAYRTTVPEVLLTAVAIALHTAQQGMVARAIGSLVRCDADSRSLSAAADGLVGGFTTEFPLALRLTDIDTAEALVGGPAAGAALVQIRDLVRSVPAGGAGYALLRYLNPETAAEFAAAESGRFTLRYRDLRPARVHTDGPADGVPLALTVDATDDGLLCRFDYATAVFVGEDVKTFAEHWVRALGGLAEHGLRPGVAPTDPEPGPGRGGTPEESAPAGSPETGREAPSTEAEHRAAQPDVGYRGLSQEAEHRGAGYKGLSQEADHGSPRTEVDPGGLSPNTGQGARPEAGYRTLSAEAGHPAPPREAEPAAPAPEAAYPAPAPDAVDAVRAPAANDPALPPDAETTSLLRPITADRLPARPAYGSTDPGPAGLPQRRPRSAAPTPAPEPNPDAGEPGSGSLPQRRSQSESESAPELTAGPGSLPQRRPRPEPESAAEPVPSSLPQRRAQPDSVSPAAAEPESVSLPQRRPRPDTDFPAAAEPESVSLPQRRPRPDTDFPATAEPEPVSLPQRRPAAQQGSESAGPSGLPQRRSAASETPPDLDGAPGPVSLPQRRPEPEVSEADPEPAPPALPQRRSGTDPASSNALSGLPQRRPQTASPDQEPAATDAPAVLPQRGAAGEPVAEQPEPARDPGLAPLPQRRPRAEPEPAATAGTGLSPLPRRRPAAAAPPAEAPAADRVAVNLTTEPESTADPEPTTFLRPIADVETTAYMSPILDLGLRDDESTLLTLFDEQAVRTPAVPAVRQGARVLSYAELDRKSRALAVELIRFGVRAQTPVAVAMQPGIDLVVAVCAVLRAGGGYLPVDPGRPAEEIDRVLSAAAPICVLSTSDEGVGTDTGISVVAIDLLYLDLPADPAADPVVAADDIADIRYLPGSDTGVTGTHRQLVERLRRAQRSHPYDSADLVLHAAPTVGDITLWELFRPLHSGAQILMPDHPGRAADLSRSIAANRVTIVHVVPALLDRFLDSVTDGGGRAAHPSLRRVVVDGAALPAGGVERFMTQLPGAELVIWYGHNETGVITVGSVGGRPVTNDRVYLLDERLRPVPPGTAGEMYIGGPQLARGYYDAPGPTASRFVAAAGGGRLYRTGDIVRRRDGVLEYLGRVERVVLSASNRGGHD